MSLVRIMVILHHQHSQQTASLQAAVLRYPSVGLKCSFLSQDQHSQHRSLWPWLRTSLPPPSDLQRRRKSLVKIHRCSEFTTKAYGGSLDQCTDGNTVALFTMQNVKTELGAVSFVLTYLFDILLLYCSGYWTSHLSQHTKISQQQVRRILQFFLVMSTAVLQLIKHLPRTSEKAPQGMMENFILVIVHMYITTGIFLRNVILQIEIEFYSFSLLFPPF